MVFIEGHTHHSGEELKNAVIQGLKGSASSSSSISPSSVQLLSNDASLDVRAKVMGEFRDGLCSVLLCGDGGARGLDIPGVNCVIQLSLPSSVDTYLHRAGRTGRLGREGKVVTLTAPGEDFVVQRLSNELYIEIKERKLKTKKKSE